MPGRHGNTPWMYHQSIVGHATHTHLRFGQIVLAIHLLAWRRKPGNPEETDVDRTQVQAQDQTHVDRIQVQAQDQTEDNVLKFMLVSLTHTHIRCNK